jgi:pyruvate dehydrogenase E1 component alpha subunit
MQALSSVRRGKPVFLEAHLERWPGSHQMKPEFATGITDVTMAWDEGRIAGPHAGWIRNHDPVLALARRLLADKAATKDEIAATDGRVREKMKAARAYADNSPYPKPETALTGVFA